MKKTKAKSKKILIIFVMLILIIGVSVVINATTFDNPVIIGFEDETLYEKVILELDSNDKITKMQLNKDDETIGLLEIKLEDDELKSITSLDLTTVSGSPQIGNLSGIEKFSNLQELNLSGNAITNMETVTQLTNLIKLNMSGNNLSSTNVDVTNTISQLTGLTTLNIANTQLNGKLNILTNLNKLENLIVSGNAINDFSAISTFNIKTLDTSTNSAFATLELITSLSELKELNISNTGITTLAGIENFEKLEKLYASNITGLQKDLNRLDALYSIYEETEEPRLKNLKVLDLSSSGITETLDSEGNIIQKANQAKVDFDDLAIITTLEELYLENMGISDLGGLVNLANLKVLDLAKNKIETDDLEDIIIEKNEVVQEENVLKATKIELQENEIIDISVFAKYPADIQYLNLSKNHIYDTTPLSKHTFGERLYLKEQDITFSIYDKAVDVNHYIILPEIFKSNKIEGSLVYSENPFTTIGLELNPNYTDPNEYNVIIGFEKTKDDTMTIKINGGNADGTILTYGIGLSASKSHNGYVTESLYFNDANLYQAMVNEINTDPQGQGYYKYILDSFIVVPQEIININRAVIDRMKLLYFDNKSIQDVTGLENCSKVTDLYLQGNDILDIRPLEGCIQMINLKLANNANLGNNNSAIEKMTKLTYLNLSNTGMTNIDSVNNLISSLRTLKLYELNVSQNAIQDITGVEKIISLGKLGIAYNQIDEQDLIVIKDLTALTTLDISGNQISSIESLSNLSNLTHLYFDKNKVESIEPLTGKTFTELSFKENMVKDITPLSAHTSINKLYMDSNQIEDVSVLENISISDEFSVAGQKISRTLSSDQTGEISIDLPQIFKAAKNSGSKVYTSNDLIFTNCQLDTTGENITINASQVTSSAAQVKIYLGKANGTTLTVTIPLIPTIQYSVSSETITNQDVTATISFNRKATITNNGGQNAYTFTQNGEFTFEYADEYGFTGTATATVGNIDKDAPVITGVENGKKYSKVTPVIQDANLQTITLTKDGAIVEGYQAGEEISKVGQYALTATDIVGNTTTVSFEIDVSDVITSKNEDVTVTEEKLIITHISPKTTPAELRNMLNAEMEYEIVDKDGNIVSETLNVGTGCKIKMVNDKVYTLIVPGDCNGDGKVTVREDMMLVNAHRLSGSTLTGYYLTAADVNENGEIKVNDMILINAIRLKQNT